VEFRRITGTAHLRRGKNSIRCKALRSSATGNIAIYQQTVQQAFRGVSDALVGYHKDREFREQQQQLALSAQDAARLSEMRYRGGATSYLEVLTNETNYFDAELGLAQAQLNELLGLVSIYRNLGGGWQQQ
jgi:multidrug efflux system outer membrane protein